MFAVDEWYWKNQKVKLYFHFHLPTPQTLSKTLSSLCVPFSHYHQSFAFFPQNSLILFRLLEPKSLNFDLYFQGSSYGS
ncbi:hypothetical protein L1887_01163 [Cichorium endivia]|nr:hypothetical protein L1887_01163 [Cichorium endivia]